MFASYKYVKVKWGWTDYYYCLVKMGFVFRVVWYHVKERLQKNVKGKYGAILSINKKIK